MKQFWLNKNNNQNLIIFFGGWGSDYHPFVPLNSINYDVLLFYDYRSLAPPGELKQILDSYENISMIGWSLGVWVANLIGAPYKNYITVGMAINGTLDPISDENGIPNQIFEGTLQNLSPMNLIKFNRRMIQAPDERRKFETNIPKRGWEELRDELKHLKEYITPSKNSFFNCAVIGANDLIFPVENQFNAWNNTVRTYQTNGSHFPFYQYNTWDDIIRLHEHKQ